MDMTRGYEPYDNEWFGERHGPVIVDLLQKMVFPKTDDNKVDTIIRRCWHGEYDSIQRLSATVKLLDGVNSASSLGGLVLRIFRGYSVQVWL